MRCTEVPSLLGLTQVCQSIFLSGEGGILKIGRGHKWAWSLRFMLMLPRGRSKGQDMTKFFAMGTMASRTQFGQ